MEESKRVKKFYRLECESCGEVEYLVSRMPNHLYTHLRCEECDLLMDVSVRYESDRPD